MTTVSECCKKSMPEISGAILLPTGDRVHRLLHSKINESLIDDLDADGRKDRPIQFIKAHRLTLSYIQCTNAHIWNMLTILLEINSVCNQEKCKITLLPMVQCGIYFEYHFQEHILVLFHTKRKL